MNRQRGSALVLTLMLAVSATTAVLTISSLASQTAKAQTSRELDLKLKYSLEGVLAKVEQSMGYKTLTLGADTNYTVNGVSWKTNTIDYSATKAKSYQVTVSGTWNGASISRSYIIGNPYVRAPFHFALWSEQDIALDGDVDTSSSPASSIFVTGNLEVNTSGCTVGGNVETTGSVIYNRALTVTGSTTTSADAVPIGSISSSTYASAADLTYGSASAINASFPADGYLAYRSGNLTFSGLVSGKGTVFVTGDLSITGNVTYANSDAMIVFIVMGKIDILGSASYVRGIYYCQKDIAFQANISSLNCNQTIFASSKKLDFKRDLNITFDDRINNSQKLGYDMHLPGYWP